jgi:hypothetical protein
MEIKCDICGVVITDYENDLYHHTGVINGVLNKHAHLCKDCHKPFMVIDFDSLIHVAYEFLG